MQGLADHERRGQLVVGIDAVDGDRVGRAVQELDLHGIAHMDAAAGCRVVVDENAIGVKSGHVAFDHADIEQAAGGCRIDSHIRDVTTTAAGQVRDARSHPGGHRDLR